ncbi:unnamed protein product, partial [Phaeothamnion confervicola]
MTFFLCGKMRPKGRERVDTGIQHSSLHKGIPFFAIPPISESLWVSPPLTASKSTLSTLSAFEPGEDDGANSEGAVDGAEGSSDGGEEPQSPLEADDIYGQADIPLNSVAFALSGGRTPSETANADLLCSPKSNYRAAAVTPSLPPTEPSNALPAAMVVQAAPCLPELEKGSGAMAVGAADRSAALEDLIPEEAALAAACDPLCPPIDLLRWLWECERGREDVIAATDHGAQVLGRSATVERRRLQTMQQSAAAVAATERPKVRVVTGARLAPWPTAGPVVSVADTVMMEANGRPYRWFFSPSSRPSATGLRGSGGG